MVKTVSQKCPASPLLSFDLPNFNNNNHDYMCCTHCTKRLLELWAVASYNFNYKIFFISPEELNFWTRYGLQIFLFLKEIGHCFSNILVLNFFASAVVLGKVRDFLGVISEANERLKLSKVVLWRFTLVSIFFFSLFCWALLLTWFQHVTKLQDNSEDHDIEVLNGNESEVIEMVSLISLSICFPPCFFSRTTDFASAS